GGAPRPDDRGRAGRHQRGLRAVLAGCRPADLQGRRRRGDGAVRLGRAVTRAVDTVLASAAASAHPYPVVFAQALIPTRWSSRKRSSLPVGLRASAHPPKPTLRTSATPIST